MEHIFIQDDFNRLYLNDDDDDCLDLGDNLCGVAKAIKVKNISSL